ncbi:MAG TPA: hypothetical protein VFA60_04505 [Terriglobales bacterium]|nr:hypothetical protein [Terriglobales bacterium]
MRILRQALVLGLLAAMASAQMEYKPKFPGDPAHSDPEAAALGYMRTVVNAQRIYYKRHKQYATSLAALVNQGSFTKRMVNPNRGDYTVHFGGKADSFWLALTPKAFDPQHRAFFINDTGQFRFETDKPATAQSPPLKADQE